MLILNQYHSDYKPIITDLEGTVKYGGTDFNFDYGTETEVDLSCSITWKGSLYIFGGNFEKRQISIVDGCQLTRIGTLSFDLDGGACTNVNNEELFLCFDNRNGNKCYKSTEPNGAFSSIADSLQFHKLTRIANDKGNLTVKGVLISRK